MRHPISRRRVLAGLAGAATLPFTGCASNADKPRGPEGVFAHGVASGDPDQHSVVLWTHLSTPESAASGRWLVARDPECRDVVKRGDFSTSVARDMTVKVLVDGLSAGQRYYYRFEYAGEQSLVGRTLTLADGYLERLGIAVASCSNYPFGYFNAYEMIARDPEVDIVLHLGDYLYEYGPDGYGGETGKLLGRPHQPPREILTLDDYRERHAQYKGDPQSRAMHAAHPLIALWDDHESANNPWTDGAQNHQPEEGDWGARRSASLQAYYEWMPVREPQPGMRRDQRWGHYRCGDLASLVTLETRHTARARQIEYHEHPDALASPEAAQAFMRDVVGAPGRRMLSDEMEAFLDTSLRESVSAGRPWRLIGNQIPMARTHTPRLADSDVAALGITEDNPRYADYQRFRRVGELGLPLYLDPWDGYPWARERFYAGCRAAGASDLLVLTGDSHSFWQNQLFSAEGVAMGVELGTTGITSPADFADFGPAGAALMDGLLAQQNPEILWTEGVTHGYIRLVLEREAAEVEYVGVSNIATRDFHPVSVRRTRVLRRDGTLAFA
ncbi:alkaline phosphatase [Mangrovimicrobium sediminis]|uniref:Alkaline phosphatase n=1 Tax=Mangrovimicrobium sediminis TaxID=2562682 RepID=A0A4Z0LW91_9GAMM|nr:alkaline phosphatase D family protein [Haliea sp. SAOS-164]TGD71510.1 alkaline phosphatase [Haliea sp. SAOS-164]